MNITEEFKKLYMWTDGSENPGKRKTAEKFKGWRCRGSPPNRGIRNINILSSNRRYFRVIMNNEKQIKPFKKQYEV